jgi:histidinol dehydrogenase
MTIIDATVKDWRIALRPRTPALDEELQRTVAAIISDVRTRGDDALLDLARRFDSHYIKSIAVTEQEIAAAQVPAEQLAAMEFAFSRVLDFHAAQMSAIKRGWTRRGDSWMWQMAEENVGQRIRPLHSAGLYVPGGLARYPSSVFMLAGPAHKAEVKKLTLATPCGPDGNLSPGVLVAARLARVDKVYKIGGASAVAALAFGTETIERVDKIVGPGNRFVNEAKRQLWGTVGVDGLYGPSEVCVMIDGAANPSFAAADLLAQLEHAPDNLGFIVSEGWQALADMRAQIEVQLESAPRADILRHCLANVQAFVVRDRFQATDIVNEIAPEHLTLSIDDPSRLVDRIANAGCILVGDWTPESAADFCLGPSHTLPTGGAARFAGPINVMDFLKVQSVSYLERDQLEKLAPTVKAMSEAEGFPAHGYATSVRFED